MFRMLASIGAFGLLTFGASGALALEPKQCLPMAEMNAALKAEGQRSLIVGDRAGLREAPELPGKTRVQRWVNLFTSNADGSLGYNIEGDQPLGQPSMRACVAAKLTNIRLLNADKPGTPAAARRGGEFDRMLAADEAKGSRPMLQADSVFTNPDGTSRLGGGFTLIGNRRDRTGFAVANDASGRAQDMFMMQNTDYTPVGLERLN